MAAKTFGAADFFLFSILNDLELILSSSFSSPKCYFGFFLDCLELNLSKCTRFLRLT